jgi:hypothetical protein
MDHLAEQWIQPERTIRLEYTGPAYQKRADVRAKEGTGARPKRARTVLMEWEIKRRWKVG